MAQISAGNNFQQGVKGPATMTNYFVNDYVLKRSMCKYTHSECGLQRLHSAASTKVEPSARLVGWDVRYFRGGNPT